MSSRTDSPRSRSAVRGGAFRRLAGLLAVVVPSILVLTAPSGAAAPAPIVIEGQRTYQVVDGFGFSEAFQRSNILHGSQGLSPANQRRALDMLFSTTTGAGFSILRNGIGSSPDSSSDHMATIEPTGPGSPDATPTYVWDGNDNSEVWLSHEAMNYGVKEIYADAWSAPGFMKTNGSDSGGGYLCGVTGTSCATGDWRQAYANYLMQYLRYYQQEGIPITHLGFVNEPDIATSYASMQSDGTQAADFLDVLGPTLARSGLPTTIACCDAAGWSQQAGLLAGIQARPEAYRYVDLVTGHGYRNPPSAPLDTDRHVWQSEWEVNSPWDAAWDDGTSASGLEWAQRIQSAFLNADVNAFNYWWGASASTASTGLIRLVGDSVTPSKRLWAFAQFSRFVRPGAVRMGASSTRDGVTVSAFRNTDGSMAVQVINTGQDVVSQDVRVEGTEAPGSAQPYLTDTTHDVAAQAPATVRGNQFTATVPARSIVTYVLSAGH